MKQKFFEGIRTRQELRKAFLALLKKYHPDNGGDAETCKILNAEYEKLMKELPTEENATQAEKRAAADMDKEIRKALEKIVHFEGINIEIVGVWIWLDGMTYQYKEQLKDLGYTWSRNRKKWHYTPYATPRRYKGKRSFEELRHMYGSETVSTEGLDKLQ